MTVYGGNQFGGQGSGVNVPPDMQPWPSNVADACAGCFMIEALPPGCDFASIDPAGDQKVLRVLTGNNVFFAASSAGLPSETYRIGQFLLQASRQAFGVSSYVLGSEVVNGAPRGTKCLAINMRAMQSVGTPQPQPYVFIAESDQPGAGHVRCSLGFDFAFS